jgi:hypothetical protein
VQREAVRTRHLITRFLEHELQLLRGLLGAGSLVAEVEVLSHTE